MFDWSQNAINVIFEEVEKMKGRPAEEIFKELGLEPKWPGLTNDEKKGMNDFLTCTIAALDQNEDEYSLQLVSSNPADILQYLRVIRSSNLWYV